MNDPDVRDDNGRGAAADDRPLGVGQAATPARRLTPTTVISVVIPCYNEEQVLPKLFSRLEPQLKSWGTDFEVVLVDDGSQDRTWELMCELNARDSRWKMIRFARNFGHQTALRAGLQAAQGDLVAVLDADLQDPPEVLPEFFKKWEEGYEVIYGVRQKRQEHVLKRAAYFTFYRILSQLAEFQVPLDAGDFSVMDRQVVDLIKSMPERKPFIRGLRSWVGFRQCALAYDRHERAAGVTKYSISRLMALALDGILSSSIVPLRIMTLFGALVASTAFLGAIVTFMLKLFQKQLLAMGWEVYPGTATTIISILFLGGVQILSVGICGEYIARIYENVKARPFWTIRETRGIPRDALST